MDLKLKFNFETNFLSKNIESNRYFMTQHITKTYKTIIGNPPYVRTKKGNLYIDFTEKKPYMLKLRCTAEPDEANIHGIETSEINDKMYFSILTYGRLFFDIKPLQDLFTYALNLVIIETVLDLKANIVVDEDCMHGVVLAAFKQSYGHIDHTNIDHVLSQLDHITLMKMMKNDRH
jgi:hypothetical protein